MSHLNVEIKARCDRHDEIRSILTDLNARFVGLDRQVDTYYRCRNGRLKLREGSIEHHLIHYFRPNTGGPKKSDVTLYKPNPDPGLKEILERSLGVLIEVRKDRGIFFVDNVKIHLDRVDPLGKYVEIEAIDEDGSIGEEKLREQCNRFIELFGIEETDLVGVSYSDMLMEEKDD